MDSLLDKAFKLSANVEVGKFTVLILDTAAEDGCSVPGAANAGPIAGVAQESVIPNSIADYSGGLYGIVSGTAWPANSVPSAATGRRISTRMVGISRVVAAAAIAVGDFVNIADAQGRVKKVDEAGGTLVHVLGVALSAAGQANDVIRVMVMPHDRHS